MGTYMIGIAALLLAASIAVLAFVPGLGLLAGLLALLALLLVGAAATAESGARDRTHRGSKEPRPIDADRAVRRERDEKHRRSEGA